MEYYLHYERITNSNDNSVLSLRSYNEIPYVFYKQGFHGLGSEIQEIFTLFHMNYEDITKKLYQGKNEILFESVITQSTVFQLKIIRLCTGKVIIKLVELEADIEEITFSQLVSQNNSEAMSILEQTDSGIKYVYNNNAHQNLTGFSSEDILGKSLSDVLGPEFYKKYEEEILSCLETETLKVFRGKASFNGTISERFCRLMPFEYLKRKFILATQVDTEFFKNWMRENDLSVIGLDMMFQANNSIMLIIDPDSGRIMDANPAACDFYGYTKEELKHLTIQDINTLTNEEVKYYRNLALQKNKEYFLFRHRLKNGEIRLVDVNSSPIEINSKLFLFSVITDATKREKNEEELFKEKELQRITMDSIGDGVVTTDNNGIITYINKAASIAVEYSLDEVVGKYFHEVFIMNNEYTHKPVINIVQTVLYTGEKQELDNHTVLHTKNNRIIPIEDSAAPILDKQGNMYGVVVIFRDVTHSKEKKKKIEYLSFHDALTGLYNRRFYYNYIEIMENENIYPLGFIMGDVNGLKMTNDVFGHTLGDKLLITVGEVIQKSVVPQNKVIRWGGDEFIIIVPNSSKDILDYMISTIKKNLSAVNIQDVIEVSVSFGYALKKAKWESTDNILKQAEEMMYQIKLLESKSMRGNTINALLTTLDEKSQETKEHTLRLSNLCTKIAEKKCLHTEAINRLTLLSVLHDIGKVGIPDYVLGKPGPLTSDEWNIMKTHPEIGYRIASNVPELTIVANEILHHHEKWDGSGYPSGMVGDDIPINCRILALVDAYDAMTNDRIYRKAKTREEALAEIVKYSGSQFDPEIVGLFMLVI
jgi:PAS domain S-box/diguanylate cyclase (GGDEF) domain